MLQLSSIQSPFLKKNKNKKIRALRAHLLRGARTQPAGYTTGYNRVALLVPSNYEVSVAHIAGPSRKEAPTTGALAVGITL